jgi:hypothetical protein
MKGKMRILGVALMVTAAFSAFAASQAFAAHSGHQWTVGSTLLGNGGEEEVIPSLMSEKATLTGTVQNQSFKMTATGLKCATGATCKIKQVIEGEAAHARATGKLTFTGISVDEPVGCKSTSEITTTNLVAEVITAPGGTGTYVKFSPESGTLFANVTLTGCAVAETYPVKGSVCAETNAIGTMEVHQKAVFSEAINTAGCGAGSLTLGGKAAAITGEATNTLLSEASWGAATY